MIAEAEHGQGSILGAGDAPGGEPGNENAVEVKIGHAARAVIPEFSDELHVGEVDRPEFVDCYEGMDLGLVDLTHVLFGFWDFANARLVIELPSRRLPLKR